MVQIIESAEYRVSSGTRFWFSKVGITAMPLTGTPVAINLDTHQTVTTIRLVSICSRHSQSHR